MPTLRGLGEAPIRALDPSLVAWGEQLQAGVDRQRIRRAVEALPVPRGRLHAPEHAEHAQRFVAGAFRQAGWQTAEMPFSFAGAAGWVEDGTASDTTVYDQLHGCNVLAVRPGRVAHQAIVVMGHYDTIRDTGGANDNGAAVAALLERAERLGHVVEIRVAGGQPGGVRPCDDTVRRRAGRRPRAGSRRARAWRRGTPRPRAGGAPGGAGWRRG